MKAILSPLLTVISGSDSAAMQTMAVRDGNGHEVKGRGYTPRDLELVSMLGVVSGFLAVLVFGWHRVSPRMHFFSTVMVALGSIFSSVWIVVANSWQQTPAGFHIVGEGLNARAEITDVVKRLARGTDRLDEALRAGVESIARRAGASP